MEVPGQIVKLETIDLDQPWPDIERALIGVIANGPVSSRAASSVPPCSEDPMYAPAPPHHPLPSRTIYDCFPVPSFITHGTPISILLSWSNPA